MFQGTPDGSRWLGLDRRSFQAIACIRQADLLGILDKENSEMLQEHLQRAAAPAGRNQTAAQALERLEEFQRENVGRNQVNSTRPLRAAFVRKDGANQLLNHVRLDHESYLQLAGSLEDLERTASIAEQDLLSHIAKRALLEADVWEQRVERARQLDGRYAKGPPPSLSLDDDLAQKVAIALRAWNDRPPVPILSGRTADDLEEELKTLPEPPDGDVESHPTVIRAHQALLDATQALDLHEDARPLDVQEPETGGASEEVLRHLARELSTPQPSVDPALEDRLEAAQQRFESLGQKAKSLATGLSRHRSLLCCFLALGFPISGLLALLAGVAFAIWVAKHGNDAERVEALEELRDVETVLGTLRHATEDARRHLEEALEQVRSLGLPVDPNQLSSLAATREVAALALRDLERWAVHREALAEQYASAEGELAAALTARGVEAGDNVTARLAEYELACKERAQIALQASRRLAPQAELNARRPDERDAQEAATKRKQAEEEVRQVALRCELVGDAGEKLVGGLEAWQRRRAEELKAHEEALREWSELETLLGGRSLADLEAEATKNI